MSAETKTPEDLERNRTTLDNVPLWNDQPLLDTFGQIQEIRTYYDFVSVDNDRYTIDGEYRGKLPRHSYCDLAVDPGSHVFVISHKEDLLPIHYEDKYSIQIEEADARAIRVFTKAASTGLELLPSLSVEQRRQLRQINLATGERIRTEEDPYIPPEAQL